MHHVRFCFGLLRLPSSKSKPAAEGGDCRELLSAEEGDVLLANQSMEEDSCVVFGRAVFALVGRSDSPGDRSHTTGTTWGQQQGKTAPGSWLMITQC